MRSLLLMVLLVVSCGDRPLEPFGFVGDWTKATPSADIQANELTISADGTFAWDRVPFGTWDATQIGDRAYSLRLGNLVQDTSAEACADTWCFVFDSATWRRR